jgi:hypothetical protein
VAENEAATQQQLARNEMSKGIADRERQQRQAARAMGQMRADMGASGFEMDSGSMLSLLAESAQEHQYDSQVIMNNAAQAAWGHQANAISAGNNYEAAKASKANAGINGLALGLNVGSTLLGGLGTMNSQYNNYLKTKKPEVWDLDTAYYLWDNPGTFFNS